MAMIPCPECKKLVSTVSTECQFCKKAFWPPAAKATSISIGYWKTVQFVGVALAGTGMLTCFTKGATLPPVLLGSGGILFLLGRIGKFWNHH